MKSNNTIPLIILTLVIAAGLYWYMNAQTGNQLPLTASSSTNAAQTQFQSLVSQLQPISFNVDIFSDPRFVSLVDLTVPVTPESSGRLDPFAAIQGVKGI